MIQYTVEFYYQDNAYFGSIHSYAKNEDECVNAMCIYTKCCTCDLACQYYAVLETMEKLEDQLPQYRGRTEVGHIVQVKATNRWLTLSQFS